MIDDGRTLYHYTCQHAHAKITGELRPGLDGFVWLTDLDAPFDYALGLTRRMLVCNRTEHRYRVLDTIDVVPYLAIRSTLTYERREALESFGTLPRHWFVSKAHVPVIYDPRGTS